MIKLFPLELEYCEAVADIAKKCLPESWSLTGVRNVLQYEYNIYYVAKSIATNEIVAFAGIMIVADEAELLNIAVLEEYRRQGIAQLLIDELLIQAQSRGAYRMLLEVRKSNQTAQSLYGKNDFHILAERRSYYSNPTEDALIMEHTF